MSDLNNAQLDTVQSNTMLFSATIPSTTTISPTTFMSFISGTTNIATIIPPVTGVVMLAFVWTTTSPGSFLTTGNISVGSTTMVQNKLNLLTFDPAANKWYINT